MIHFNTVTADQFFQNLSQADGKVFWGYNKGFEIDSAGHNAFTIREATKGAFNPFQIHHDDQRKLATANNLASLIALRADHIAQKAVAGADGVQIGRVLQRYKETQTEGMVAGPVQNATRQAYDRAIQALNTARNNHDLSTLRANVSPRGKTQHTVEDFVDKFASKGWVFSPNFKFHVKREVKPDGTIEFTPYTSRKQFWLEKLVFGRATSAIEKKATMVNLEALLNWQMPGIEGRRLNASAIERNIERLSDRMTRNMSAVEKGEIDTVVNRLKGRLQLAQQKIDADRSGDPLWNIWWGIKWSVLAPLRLTKFVAWDNITRPLGGLALAGLYNAGAWTANKTGLATAARKIHACALISWGGLKTAAGYPIAFAKGTYKHVISPTVEMAGLMARGAIAFGKLPIHALNSFRQVTA